MEWSIAELILIGVMCGLAGGAIGGTLAGLAGVGGGLIYVPLFYATMPGDQEGASLHILGSLVAVALTGGFSARAHWRLDHVHLLSFKKLYPGLVIGAAIGLWSTLHIEEGIILLTLAALDLWVGRDFGKHVEVKHAVPLTVASGPIGYISGALGIGGGTMLVPLLRRAVSIKEAVGTSAICGAVMAIGAVVFNLLFEPQWHSLIEAQIYYLLGAWAGILIIIPRASGWSAWLHASMKETTMRSLLKALFYTLSAIMFVAGIVSLAS